MSLKVLGGALIALALYGGYHKASLYVSGYEAWQIEDDLCKGHRLVEQDIGDTSIPSCSRTKIGDPIQVSLRQHQVDSKKRFLLSDLGPLCTKRGEEPRDIGGKLACMPQNDKMAKK